MKFVTAYTNHFHSKIFRKKNEVIVKVRRYKSQGKNDGRTMEITVKDDANLILNCNFLNDGRTMEITVKDEIGVFDNY